LADRAIVALNTVIRLEQGTVDSRSSTLKAIRRALEAAGIEFLSLREESEGIRVRHGETQNDGL
jgi:predicted transcriptional regulator